MSMGALPVASTPDQAPAAVADPTTQKGDAGLDEAILALVKHYSKEGEADRERVIRTCRRNHSFWKGIQRIFWDDRVKDWRVPERGQLESMGMNEDEINRVINVFKAWGESIIAALSAQVPKTRFFPENADVIDDVMTARSYSKIVEMIRLQNDMSLLFIQALFTLWNEHFVAFYNCAHESEEFGTVTIDHYGLVDAPYSDSYCPDCGTSSQPSDEDPVDDYGTQQPMETGCPECGSAQPPIMEQGTRQVPGVVSQESKPKSRLFIQAFGALNVKLPYNISSMADTPYLLLETEHYKEQLSSIYPDLSDKIMGKDDGSSGRAARKAPDSVDPDAEKMATVQRCWLRPWSFYWLKGESQHQDKVDALLSAYPKGLYSVVIEDHVAEKVPEALDEHWTVTISPTSRTVHADPLGNVAVPIQEMYNDAIDLTAETIAQGVPETFADPGVVNFQELKTRRAAPGMMTPARPRPGQNLDQSFFTLKPAVLGKEVPTFASDLLQSGQLVTKAFPSVYGGSMQGGSKTLGEYERSRSQALTTLGPTWAMLCSAISQLDFKSVEEFRQSLIEDEHFTQAAGGGFANIWIRKSEMEGRVGRAAPEVSEAFPMTWAEKRSVLTELLGMQLPPLMAALFNNDNVDMTTSLLGLTEFQIPGQADRDDELLIVQDLLKSQPQMGMMGPEASIPIEPDVENPQVRSEVLKAWCVSPAGREAKTMNPGGYQNVLSRLKEFQGVIQQQMMRQAMTAGGPGGGPGGPPPPPGQPGDPSVPDQGGAVGAPDSGPGAPDSGGPTPPGAM